MVPPRRSPSPVLPSPTISLLVGAEERLLQMTKVDLLEKAVFHTPWSY